MNNKKSNRFSPEVRERAVRMVQEHWGEYPSLGNQELDENSFVKEGSINRLINSNRPPL